MSQFLVLRAIAYQDNHLLLNLLNQNGFIYTVLCVGGSGSAKKKLGQKTDLGQVIKIQNFQASKTNQYFSLREFEVVWSPIRLRKHYQAWGVLNFIAELSIQILHQKELSTQEVEELKNSEFVSREYEVISKFLMLIDDWSSESFTVRDNRMLTNLFLVKIIMLQGLTPPIKKCHSCLKDLLPNNIGLFQSPHFFCNQCSRFDETSQALWDFLLWAINEKYESLRLLNKEERKYLESNIAEKCLNEFLFLLNVSKKNLKSLSLISD